VDGPEAWDVTQGSSTVVIAVMDTGVDYNHPDLAGNIWSNPGEVAGNTLDDDNNGYVDDIRGWDFVDDDNDPVDVQGHGTHVSGTIAAVGNNGIGVTGVCWQAKIMPLRTFDAFSGGATSARIIAAIGYAVNKGAKVINASFGGPDYSQAEYDALSSANSAGVLFVAAAGNETANNDTTPAYPAGYNLANIISVAATDQNDGLTYFSNYGATSVHVAAPGQNIYSTVPADRLTIWSDNFDDGDISDWTRGGTNNTWGLTNSKAFSGAYSLTESPSGDYLPNTASWARAPALNLSSRAGATLTFWVTGKSQEAERLVVQTSTDGTSWTDQEIYLPDLGGSLPGLYGDGSDKWYRGEVDLGKYDGKSTVYIRFYFTSSSSGTGDGWYIDDLSVTAASSSYAGTEYGYMAGTSMATPHVVGLAGLMWSYDPSFSMDQVRDAIISTVDKKSSLAGKVTSGGRINAHNPFLCFGTVETPSSLVAEMGPGSGIHLAWVDNSGYEIGFKIERRLGADGTYAQIDTVPTHVASYTDTGASPGEAYYYRVRSYNCTTHSDYSNEASTITETIQSSGGSTRGGCLIATAAFGSSLAPQVAILREFRDRILIKSAVGRSFIRAYDRYSPALAGIVEEHETLRVVIRFGLLPLVAYGYWSILIGHGITLILFSGLFLMLVFCGFTKIRKGQEGGDLPRN
jgi:subtilisin family serine protease